MTRVLWLSLLVGAGGCSAPPAAAPGGSVVRFLANPDRGGGTREAIARLEREDPGVKIDMVEGPPATNTREDMYAVSFLAKEETYDLVFMDVAWLAKFASQGWLKPLDGLIPAGEREAFLPAYIRAGTYGGSLYSLPVRAEGGLLYYRKDLLDGAGIQPPDTWEELVQAAKRLQRPELAGFVFQGKQYEGLVCAFLEFVWTNAGELIDDRGRVLIDRPEAVEALSLMSDMIRRHRIVPEAVLTYQEEEARHAFQAGRAVFMRNWTYAWNLLQAPDSPVRGKVGVLPIPRGRGPHASVLGGWGFGVSAFSRRPEAAWRVASGLASAPSLKTVFLKNGALPTRLALYQDPELLRAIPQAPELARILAGARPRPRVPYYSRVSDSLQVHVSAALAGIEEPSVALEAASREIRAIVAREAAAGAAGAR